MFRPLTAMPLLGTQRGIWMAQARDPDSPAFNTGRYLDIPRRLDPERFVAAVTAITDLHDILRVRIDEVNGQPTQRVLDQSLWHPQVVDLSAEVDPFAAALARMQADMALARDVSGAGRSEEVGRRPGDLVSEVLFLLSRADDPEPGRSLWYQRAHHIITDGVGHSLLFSQIARAYAGRTPTTAPSLQQLIDAELAEPPQDLPFWLEQRSEQPLSPGGAERAPQPASTHLRHSTLLPAAGFARLEALAAACGGSWVDAVTVAAADLTAGLTDATEATLGFPLMRRTSALWRRTPAPRVTVLPLRVQLTDTAKTPEAADSRPVAATVQSIMAATRDQVRAAAGHQQLLGEDLRAAAGLRPGDRLFGPQLNIKPFHDDLRIDGVETRMIDLSAGPVEDLTISVYPLNGGLHIDVDGNPQVHTSAAVARLRDRLVRRLTTLAERSPEARLIDPADETTTLLLDDEQRALDAWNATEHAVSAEATTVPQLIAECAAQHPHAPAVSDDERSLTFAQFTAAVDAAAHRLQTLGVAHGDVVGVHLPRSVDLLVAVHAVMRCGAVYLPLDVDYPPLRLAHMMEDARAAAVVTADAVQVPTPAHGAPPRILTAQTLLRERAATSAVPAEAQAPAGSPAASAAAHLELPDADDLAYVLFTSGSTGRPKGVEITHRSLVNRVEWMADSCGTAGRGGSCAPGDGSASGDTVLHKTPIGFDVSVWELTLPLICGAHLQIAPPGAHRDPEQLVTQIRRHQVTVVHFVPTMLQTLLSAFDEDRLRESLCSLRVIVCSGEALPPALALRLRRVSGARLLNLYGPTEATIDVTFFDCSARSDAELQAAADLPIGAPVWNTTLYVVDPFGRRVPIDAPGELCIGGVQVARGYIGRPDLTAARFTALPVRRKGGADASSRRDERVYATGDRARWAACAAAEGASEDPVESSRRSLTGVIAPARLHFLGRRDGQVKLHGQRLELDEVARALAGPTGLEAAARLHDTATGDHVLVGYVVGDEAAAAQAWDRCRAELPAFMVPGSVVPLDHLPLSPSGKLDRRALPQPAHVSAGQMPADGLERRILGAFLDVLAPDGQLDGFGVTDDFFAWGGTSLTSVALLAELRQLHLPLELGDLFATPTVRALADLARRQWATGETMPSAGYAPVLRFPTATATSADASAQASADDAHRAQWFLVHPAGGLAWPYRQLAGHLDGPAFGLQASAYTDGELPTSLADTAQQYAHRVLELAADRPIRLLGWSVGGVIAQDMCAALEATGHEVDRLVLLDCYPGPVWRNRPAPTEADAALALIRMAGIPIEQFRPQADLQAVTDTGPAPADTGPVPADTESVLQVLRDRRHPLGELGGDRLSIMRALVHAHSRMLHEARHRPSHAPTLFVTADGVGHEPWQDPAAWEPWLTGQVDLLRLPIRHEQLVLAPWAQRITDEMTRSVTTHG